MTTNKKSKIIITVLIFTFSLFLFLGYFQKDNIKTITESSEVELELKETRGNIEIYHTLNEGVDCYLVKPEGDGPFSAFVLNHGGFGSAELFSIDVNNNNIENFVGTGNGIFLAEKGYVSIACDYTHKDLKRMNLRKVAIEDGPGASEENIKRALNAIDILKKLNYVDENNIYMLGNSMGGFLTVGVAQKTNNLKAAIVIVAGIKDGNPSNAADRIIELVSPPEELVKNITCPILMLNGEDDATVNIKYTNHLKDLLDENKKVSKLIIYPNIGHNLLRSNQDEVYREIFSFINDLI